MRRRPLTALMLFLIVVSLSLAALYQQYGRPQPSTSGNVATPTGGKASDCLAPTPEDYSSQQIVPDTVNGTVSGNTVPAVLNGGAKLLGQVPDSFGLHLSVVLKMRNGDQFQKCLAAIINPESADYQHFLNATTLAPYSPPPGQRSSIGGFIAGGGFSVTAGYSPIVLNAVGTVRSARELFGIGVNFYEYGNRTFYAADAEPKMPKNLAALVSGVIGLDNFTMVKPVSQPCTGPYCPQGLQVGYSIAELLDSGYDGAGQTIAVTVMPGDPNIQAALDAFSVQNGLPKVTIDIRYPDGQPSSWDSGWGLEADLDVEAIHAMAPAAGIIVVYDEDPYNAVDYVAANNLAKIVSNSWGSLLTDDIMPSSILDAYDARLAADAAQGLTMLFASGDYGNTDIFGDLGVTFPATDPNVLAVGGTDLTLTGCGVVTCLGYGGETGWAGSGGGYSGHFAEPIWQTAAIGAKSGRATPDVAMLAGSPTFWTYTSTDGWIGLEGTSLAAPLWAGFLGIVLQIEGSGVGFGNIAPRIYALGSGPTYAILFNDIVGGSNGYPAVTGWDPVTGWGTPKADVLAFYLAQRIPLKTIINNSLLGSITPAPGTHWYAPGSRVNLTASPIGSNLFAGWSSANSAGYTGENANPTITLSEPLTEIASFSSASTTSKITVQPGVGADALGTVLAIDGASYSYGQLPHSFNWTVGSVHQFSASTPVPAGAGKTYVFTSWINGDGLSGSAGTYVVPSVDQTVTAGYEAQFSVTYASPAVSADASGVVVTVDGQGYTKLSLPLTLWYKAGTQSNFAFSAVVPADTGKRYVWSSTSGCGQADSNGAFAVSAACTVTGTFRTQYLLTTAVAPPGLSSVTAVPQSADGYYDSGTLVSLTANLGSSFMFTGWSGTGIGSYSGGGNPANILMLGPIDETANFVQVVQVTFSASGINPNVSAVLLTVDGVTYSTGQLPKTFTWAINSAHNVTAQATVTAGLSTRYVFASWSNGGTLSNATGLYVVPSTPQAVTANYELQYFVSVSSFPSAGGTTAPAGPGVWAGANSTIQLTASPSANYTFTGWTGNRTSADSSLNMTVSGPVAETANFALTSTISFALSGNVGGDSSGTVLTVDGENYTFTDFPRKFAWPVGSVHQIYAPSVSAGAGKQYAWAGWLGAGAGALMSNPGNYTVPSSNQTVTALFRVQYGLTLNVFGVGGATTPPPGVYWHDLNQTVLISAMPNFGYGFSGWTGTGPGSYSGATANMTVKIGGPVIETAAFLRLVGVTFTVTGMAGNESDIVLTVDGQGYIYTQMPAAFNWIPGSVHPVAASTAVASGTASRYAFKVWASGGTLVGATGNYTVPASNQTVTANYATQYRLSVQVLPTSGGTVTPADATWADVGAQIQISATAAPGYGFGNWTGVGSGSYSGGQEAATITVNGPVTEIAYFFASVSAIVTSSPTGAGYVTVDGVAVTTPASFTWTYGSKHVIAAAGQISCGTGCVYAFKSWSDGGAQSHTVTATSPAVYTVTVAKQYQLTMAVSPSGAGTTTPAAPGMWAEAGSSVQITATANASYSFGSWKGTGTGSYTGTNRQATITVNGPIAETANFTASGVQVTFTVSGLPDNSGITLTVDGENYGSSSIPATLSWTPGSVHSVSITDAVPAGSGQQYAFASWINGGGLTAASGTFTAPAASKTVTATYASQFALIVTAGTGGTTAPAPGPHWYNSNASAQVSATPSGGYAFSSWTLDGAPAGTQNPVTVTMGAPHNITAVFGQQVTLTVGINDPEMGSTAPPPGTYEYAKGAAVEVSASAGAGYSFLNWVVDGLKVTAAGPYNVTMNADHNVTAVFGPELVPMIVNSSPAGPGYILVDGVQVSTPANFNWSPGSQHNISAVQAASKGAGIQYAWVKWSDGGSAAHTITVVRGMPATYTATFKVQYALTMLQTRGAGLTVPASPGNYWYDNGTVVDASAIPGSGSQFDHWALDGSAAGRATAINVTMSRPHDLQAMFTSQVFQVYVAVNPTGLQPQPTCTPTCTGSPPSMIVDYGTLVAVTAPKVDGWTLVHMYAVTSDGSQIGSGQPGGDQITFPMPTANVYVRVVYGYAGKKSTPPLSLPIPAFDAGGTLGFAAAVAAAAAAMAGLRRHARKPSIPAEAQKS